MFTFYYLIFPLGQQHRSSSRLVSLLYPARTSARKLSLFMLRESSFSALQEQYMHISFL